MPVNDETHDSIHVINGYRLKQMFISALNLLEEQKSLIDSLNVFPVPDGDTGTNMYLTFLEAIKEVKKINSGNVCDVTSALARGALMGARGNSGVILSQLLRGFSQINENNKKLQRKELVLALNEASEIAYQGVLKPVEGTILTVARKAAEGAELGYDNNLSLIGIFESAIEAARKALNETPEQLSVLKEAEVVDAGGQGYLVILEGMLEGLQEGENLQFKSDNSNMKVVKTEMEKDRKKVRNKIKYEYCTQVIVYMDDENGNLKIDEIRNDLQNYGDSLLVVGTNNIIKIHIHTNHPGVILENALKFGSLNDINIDNLKLQSDETSVSEKEIKKIKIKEENEEPKIKNEVETNPNSGKDKIGIIAVARGKGIKDILNELRVDKIIDGGQSMNPSTNDFLAAIEDIDSNKIIILPNNKNIISAAKQAASISDKHVGVILTRTIPEAITALLSFDGQLELSELKEKMEQETQLVKTLEITNAVKNSKINGLRINKGDIIGLFEGNVEVKGDNYNEVVADLFNKIWKEEDLITIYYGQEVGEENALELREYLREKFELEEIEIYDGCQPLYPYIISLE